MEDEGKEAVQVKMETQGKDKSRPWLQNWVHKWKVLFFLCVCVFVLFFFYILF